MKKVTLVLGIAATTAFLIFTSCKKEETNPTTPSTPNSTVTGATIGSTQFTPTSSTATATSTNGYNLKFTDNNSTIQLNTSKTGAGTYTICATGNCRTEADGATATVTTANVTYSATTGTLTITISIDGKVSGTYTFDAKSSDNQTVSVKNGAFNGIVVTSITGSSTTTGTNTVSGITTNSGSNLSTYEQQFVGSWLPKYTFEADVNNVISAVQQSCSYYPFKLNSDKTSTLFPEATCTKTTFPVSGGSNSTWSTRNDSLFIQSGKYKVISISADSLKIRYRNDNRNGQNYYLTVSLKKQ